MKTIRQANRVSRVMPIAWVDHAWTVPVDCKAGAAHVQLLKLPAPTETLLTSNIRHPSLNRLNP